MGNFDDEKIASILKADIYEPDSYTKAIQTALKIKKKRKQISISKVIAVITAGSVVIGGLAYAKEIKELISRLFNDNLGVDTAVQNGYISTPNIKFASAEGTEIEVKNMLMDDKNLSFIFQLKLKDINVAEIKEAKLNKIIISDENNNILYSSNLPNLIDFSKNNNLNFENLNIIESNETGKGNINIENNYLNMVVSITTENNYPKSKKLKLNIGEINLKTSREDILISNNWEAEIDVPEKFYNRKAKVYCATNCSNPKLKITDFCVYKTCTTFEFNSQLTAGIEEKVEDLMKWYIELGHNVIENAYIEDSNGKKYYPAESSFADSGTLYSAEGSLKYWNTFTLTQFDMTDKLTLHFDMYTKEGEEKVVIEFERKS